MVLAAAQKPMTQIIAKTVSLYELFSKYGDEERAEKAKLFLRKLHEEEFIVAFCGHFSAGKSTMINELTGEKLLPSSPIPTSANLVKIHQAEEDFAKVYYKNKEPLLFTAPYRFEKVKEFCKNGEEVETIEIGHSESSLPPEVTVMDTPGVDSTDDAHRISTESALHLADMVLYVMDYNHVQSELNFIYTKDLLSHGVKLYLIINQVDKHREEELAFTDFQQSVYDSFASWNVHPERFFFTSLKNRDLPYNDFDEVKELIHTSMRDREELSIHSANTMVSRLVSEHLHWLKETQQEQKEINLELLGEAWDEEEIIQNEEKLKEQLNNKDALAASKEYEANRAKVLENAYLMPATTRDLAKSYLESVQPDFKVGLFFSKKKTEEEQARRLKMLMDDLKEKTEAQLEWHLRQVSAKWLKTSGLIHDGLQLEAEELTVPFDETVITETVKPGARVTGDYVLNYCDEVAAKLKRIAREETDDWKDEVVVQMQQQFAEDTKKLKETWSVWNEKRVAIEELSQLEDTEKKRQSDLDHLLNQPELAIPDRMEALIKEWKEQNEKVAIFDGQEDIVEKPVVEEEVKAAAKTERQESPATAVSDTVSKLKKMGKELDGIPGFQRFIDGLKQKADRLEQQKYTIALFGAFSAGKSSFANAMLGEKVLPVSPNPTTAAVNRIHPPTDEFLHRTAAVHLKTENQMLKDLQHSLELFSVEARTLSEANQLIPKLLQTNDGEGREKIHLSFLKAFHDGFMEYKDQLGETLTVDLPSFQSFVANEKQSCFVESIDLYFDCEFTRQGVTLVDTPGADSINARHTGVAFEYIKNSDAILFVTYYNHAFSKADREFLIQLGRVKDAFELDKMFFIVNAIDLAEDEEELQDVLTYVQDQLVQYGIRFPRLFGVSSLQAIQEAERGELDHPHSNMLPFKQSFHQFLNGDLAQMAVQSAEAEWNRGLEQLRQLVATAKENRDNREQKTQELNSQNNSVQTHLSSETPALMEKRLSQEVNELIYYVKQRVFYRFSDFFKESFNPAVFSGNGNVKALLNQSLKELLDSVGYDLAQEMRATSLRAENHTHQLLNEKYTNLQLHYQSIQPQLLFTPIEWTSKETPEFVTAFQEESLTRFSQALSVFKNAKSFFEKNEKQVMQAQLEDILSELADQYLETQKEILWNWVNQELQEGLQLIKETIASDSSEQFAAWLEVLDRAENIEEWEQKVIELAR
ncbi:putative GTPase [Bacillus ectoiniformans]|uniref:dynamin family protein n=1 Tax=Bacillus ectoiniformans TaxID=1494429 RepID=UPI001956A63B|nr:dynamin family protein [Bacillus ectoiniformans]MBM7647933.1 putative GTPase [Bacillus ectoiniformans]